MIEEIIMALSKFADIACDITGNEVFAAFNDATTQYFQYQKHLTDVEKRYIRPIEDPTGDYERDKALITQRIELARLLESFDDALTEFEKKQPIPDEYDNTEKE